MIDWKLLKCAFGHHNYGTKLHDDMFNKWVMICRVCGKHVTVNAPLDENGKAEDPHEWLMKQDIFENSKYEIGYDLAIDDDCGGE